MLMFALLMGLEILFLIVLKSLYDLANPQVWGALFRAHVCAAAGFGNFCCWVRKRKKASIFFIEMEKKCSSLL